jgi:hypothetical protein
MTLDEWLAAACTDADRRNLPELKPLLSALARATAALRAADWNEDAADPGVTRTGDDPGSRPAADTGATAS